MWARSIGTDTKTRSLLSALEIGFKQMAITGAQSKALIFTESRRTQIYLKDYLEANGYAGQVVQFSGTNNSPEATAIYENWLTANQGTGRIAGSRDIDIRTALIEHFQGHASIMIATEAAAEGVNIQFCSLVINYDLPWNPQRVEQRIGRCHRYGQQHDVVVISQHATRLHVIEALCGKHGYLALTALAIESYEREEHLLFSAIDDQGLPLEQETCEKLVNCLPENAGSANIPDSITQRLAAEAQRHTKATISQSLEANKQHFNEAREKLEKWADDLVLAAEKALKDTKEQIKILQRQARLATHLAEQHDIQQKIQKLEKQQRRQRQEIFQVEDSIIEKRDGLIEALERRLTQKTESERLFTIEWSVI